MNENRILPADELPEENDLNDALVRDGKGAILPAEQDGQEKVPDLYRLAFVPGMFQCPKCKFVLVCSTMNVATGQVGTTEEDRQSEPCPNDGALMVHVTYKEHAETMTLRLEEQITRAESAESRLAAISARVEPFRKLLEECLPNGDRSPADVYYARSILRDRLYDAFPGIAALVPPVEKEK